MLAYFPTFTGWKPVVGAIVFTALVSVASVGAYDALMKKKGR